MTATDDNLWRYAMSYSNRTYPFLVSLVRMNGMHNAVDAKAGLFYAGEKGFSKSSLYSLFFFFFCTFCRRLASEISHYRHLPVYITFPIVGASAKFCWAAVQSLWKNWSELNWHFLPCSYPPHPSMPFIPVPHSLSWTSHLHSTNTCSSFLFVRAIARQLGCFPIMQCSI